MTRAQITRLRTHSPLRQQGVVLIMSLAILLVLTLLGIAAMRSSNLQIVMSGNSQFQVKALSNAEAAINAGQIVVEDLVLNHTVPPTGYYNLSPESTSGAVPIDDFINYTWVTTPGPGQNAIDPPNVVSSAYVIEYSGPRKLPDESVVWRNNRGIPGDKVYVYKITAQSTSSRGAMRRLQSIYVTEQSPF